MPEANAVSSKPAHNSYHPGRSSLLIEAIGKPDCQEARTMAADGRLLEMGTLCTQAGAARTKYLKEDNVGPVVSELSRSKSHQPVGVIRNGQVWIIRVVKHGQGNFTEIQSTRWASTED